MPIAYLKTKTEFLQDAPVIEDILRAAVTAHLGFTVASGLTGEYASWQHSLGNALFHVLNDDAVPGHAGVALEFRMSGSRLRIDALISGQSRDGVAQVAIVELKQWSDVALTPSDLKDFVLVRGAGGLQLHLHPSAQALDYACFFEDFYVEATEGRIRVHPCAFTHNVQRRHALDSSANKETLEKAPLFTKSEGSQFRRFLSEVAPVGDGGAAIRQLDRSEIAPSKQLADRVSSLLRGSPEFHLFGRQKEAFERILQLVKSNGPGQQSVLIVKGGPGTGKSVIALQVLGRLLASGKRVRYVTKNAAPRSVYGAHLRADSVPGGIRNLLVSSDSFVRHEAEKFDVLLVDEAHRLVHKSGVYRNLGENQIVEILAATRTCVFFTDESQIVTWRDIGTLDEIRRCAADARIPVTELELDIQFRCSGADDYVDFVDRVLGILPFAEDSALSGNYLVEVVDSPLELARLVEHHNHGDPKRSSRLLAGYCWNWVSKKDSRENDIVLGDGFARKWNLASQGQAWLAVPEGADQVGCVFTAQGLECPFVGVIMGDDLVIRDGRWVVDLTARASTDRISLWGMNTAMKTDPDATLARAGQIVRNQYKVLLTRGMKGTYIYSTDEETRAHLRSAVSLAKARGVRAA